MDIVKKGRQLISFEGEKAPKQAEILAALQAMGTDMYSIQGLQNAGINRYILYPIDEDTPILDCPNFKVQWRTAHVSHAPPFERQIGSKVMDIHITGMPMNIDEIELRNKIYQRLSVSPLSVNHASIWGWAQIHSGGRIIAVHEEDAKKNPTILLLHGLQR
ncbi:hypothetical protein ACJMK2_028331 [Sinanodonta woodiana]|uniref:Uncharacterized protein n=1 Tax=Sinanodonta woodiana TaxID=1069815 RepID=A0ABD3XAC9_SINWO